MSDAQGALPDGLLYVPTRPSDGSGRALIEMRTLPDGRLALVAFTSLAQLTRCCGARQPWLALDDRGLADVEAMTGYDLVLVDVKIPPEPVRKVEDDEWEGEGDVGDHIPRSFMHSPIGTTKRKKR